MTKNKLGQYFTTNELLKEKLYEFILNNPKEMLEPSTGRGDLVSFIQSKNKNVRIDMFEIDDTIEPLKNIKKTDIKYCDFLKHEMTKTYDTIIGNPPYVKTKKGNLYINFIEKCFKLLNDNGELIFIVPSDFLKLTSSSKLLNDMINEGFFTHIYHPNDEKLFTNATIDVLIFRYLKNKTIEKITFYNDKKMHVINSNGLITFNEIQETSTITFNDYFDIYVGLVSGNEKIFKNNELGNITILTKKNKLEKYIFIKNYPCDNENINELLLKNKNILMNRKIKKFNEKTWFQWGAPRNINIMDSLKDKPCIYVYNLTRNNEVAFIDKVKYFNGGLIILIPKNDCDLNKINNYLNGDIFKKNFTFSGRFKIGHRQLCCSIMPNNLL